MPFGGSTMEWSSSSRMSKHRIKPRKIKFVVDIYATALRSTLEDLDRRNGTKWAALRCTMEQRTEYEMMNSAGNVNGYNKEGPEDVDSSGTKSTSLSKFSDFRSNYNAKEYCLSSKPVRGTKQRTFHSSNSSKILARKHNLLKYPHNGQLCCTSRSDHRPKDNDCQRRNNFSKVYEDEYTTRPVVKACDQTKPDELRMKNLWVVPRRTGLKKINLLREKHLQNKIVTDLKVKGNLSACGVSCIKSRSDSNSPVFCDENPPPSPFENHKREKKSRHDIECSKQPSMRKRTGLASLACQEYCHSRIHYALSGCNVKQSRKDGPSLYENSSDPLNNTESCDLFHHNRRTEVDTDPAFDADGELSNSRKYDQHAVSSADKDFASPSQDGIPSAGDKKLSFTGKRLPVTNDSFSKFDKKPRIQYSYESDEEAVFPRSALCRQRSQVKKLVANEAHIRKDSGQPSSTKRGVFLNLRKKKVLSDNSGKEGSMTSKGSDISSESYSHIGIRKSMDSCIGSGVSENTLNALDYVRDIEIGNYFVSKQNSQMADGETFTTFNKSLDSAFYGPAGPSAIECNSKHCIKACDKHYQTELLLGGESEMFCAYKVVENVLTPETHAVAELDTNKQEGNYFVDVDPISIPGPPGSFLPSPGRMSSEELQGNSSLTTCRLQSAEDIDSSMVPESIDTRPSLPPVVYSSEHLCNYEDRIDHVQSACSFVHTGCAETKPNHLDRLRDNVNQPDVSPRRFKNGQFCYCSRKEGPFQGEPFSYHESLQQTITSRQRPPGKLQADCNLNKEAYCFNLRPEPAPMPEKNFEYSRMRCAPLFVSQSFETKFSTCRDSPSAPNPVLRLMGKNLMVLNKDENSSPETKHAQLNTADSHPRFLSNVHYDVSTVKVPHEHGFTHGYLSQAQPKFAVQGLSSHSALSNHLEGSFSWSLGPHQYVGGCNWQPNLDPKLELRKLNLLVRCSSELQSFPVASTRK